MKVLICLGKENDKLRKAFGDVVGTIHETQSVKALVRLAMQVAQKGDVVLLSPACEVLTCSKTMKIGEINSAKQ